MGKARQTCNDFTIKMGDTVLERVKSIKYLGVIFDENFKWHDHVKYLSQKLSRGSGILSKLRYYTNTGTLLKVYNSLIGSHLNYSLLAWGSAGQTALQPLRVLQNRAIRFMARSPRYRRLDLDYLNLRILKLDDIFKLTVAKFMHRYHHNNLPPSFDNFFPLAQPNHGYNTRSTVTLSFQALHCKKASTERSIRYKGPKLWEEIPINFRNFSKSKFKKDYTNRLLANY